MSDQLEVAAWDGRHVLTLNRPDRGNALSPTLVEELHVALDRVEADRGRLVVLEGRGRNFCTGFDLTDAPELSDGDLLLRFVRIEQLLARLWSAPYATLAIGQGRVFGAGADLFAACAQRLAMAGASFCFPGAGFGLLLGTRRLQARVGATAADRLVAGGEVVTAETAVALGLATACVAKTDLAAALDAAQALAMRLDRKTYGGLRAIAAGPAEGLDADLAALVRSAAQPGLGGRIAAYAAVARART